MDRRADLADRPGNRLALVYVVTFFHQALGRFADMLQQR